MLRYKQFTGSGADLERAINRWLAEYEPEVTQMVQTPAGSACLAIGFLFQESFRSQELRLAEESTSGLAGSDVFAPSEFRDDPLEVISESIPPARSRDSG